MSKRLDRATQGLILKEPTIFERSSEGRVGFKLPPLGVPKRSPEKQRKLDTELPEVSELGVVRHFTRLSSWNYSIDLGTLPLGSCTMKYNPRINEELASISSLCDVHPETPEALCQGSLEILHRLQNALCSISGLDACSLQPAAGAFGELAGLMVIRAFHKHHDSGRHLVLIPDSAHGTNPASCAQVGYQAVTLPTGTDGNVNIEAFDKAIKEHGRSIAAMMITNPSTLGLFEPNIAVIAEKLHAVGAQLYLDGANMNAVLAMAKPSDMGVDVMHFNLHKTFSTPHGGGGPGAGPIAVRKHLAPFLPTPVVEQVDESFKLAHPEMSVGKVKGFFGNYGMFVRALAYILHHGPDGLRDVSRAAVLNANYVRTKLSEFYPPSHATPSFHECVLTDAKYVKTKGVKTLQIAKALIDKGFHPPTVYFPLIVPGALLIEPTETESLQELDELIAGLTEIAQEIEQGSTFDNAPTKTIVGKVDEVGAARKPILTLDDRPSQQ